MKTYKICLTTLLAIFALDCASAQMSERSRLDRLESARQLYFSGSYYAAEKAFSHLEDETVATDALDRIEIEAFKVMCAVAMDKINADGQVMTFCYKYPNAPQQAMVKHALASRFFDRGEYTKALNLFNSINVKHLRKSQVTDFEFRKAYCDMRVGNYADAIATFRKIVDNEPYSMYTIPGTYYLAYSLYIRKDFEQALPLFEKCSSDQRFSAMSSYYAVECAFMMNGWDYVESKAPVLMNNVESDLQAKLAKILSETFYSTGDNVKALEYLDLYRDLGNDFSRKDYYLNGILSYGLKRYDDAIESFSYVIGEDDDLRQNAYYYSANSQLEMKNKVAALEAFKAASERDFDSVIKEDAMFNYAKLSFDVNADISQFDRYIEAYPKSGKEDVINNYMAASFILAKNYRSAVDVLSKIHSHTCESETNLQKAAFFRAMQFIESRSYRSAIPVLELSIKHGRWNAELSNLAKYWLSECYYRNDRFSDAVKINLQLLESDSFADASEMPEVLYNLAYCYFKSGDFESAQKAFGQYGNLPARQKNFDRDAKVRRADSYFMLNDYSSAAALYESVYNVSDEVYPAFQAAVAYGLMGNDSKKIALLKQVTRNNRNSELYPKALFELGRTYVQNAQDDEASECFYTLLGMKADNTYYSKALLELGMINANNKKYERAIEYYKDIIKEAPYSEEVQDALSALESIYQSQNRPEEFLAYIEMIGMSDIKTADEKEMMLFGAAEQLFFSKKDADAMKSIEKYLAAYPEGAKAPVAAFYRAEILNRAGSLEKAADAYYEVMKMGMSESAEAATSSYARICLQLQNYGKAIEAFSTLISISTSANAVTSAHLGRMRAYFGEKEYQKAIRDAQTVSSDTSAPKDMLREAQFVMAKSYQTVGDRDMARNIFTNLASDVSDDWGAESAYLMILSAYDNGNFEEVEKRVYDFADSGADKLYWLAKSFIVLGDSFADRDDMEQAKATFESILEGYEPGRDDDDVLEQVRTRLEMINK